MRIYAIVRQTDLHPPTRHFEGLPASLHPGGRPPEPEGWPRALVIEIDANSALLDRFADDGSSVGDTWHQSVEDAKEQAEIEYQGLLSDWHPVPRNVSQESLVEYLLAKAREARQVE